MDEVYFIFNNISSQDYLTIKTLPSIFKAQKDINLIEVEGRSGFLTQDLGSYRGIVKSVECIVKDLSQVDYICEWLDGSGEVIFSNEPDKVYKAVINNQIELSMLVKTYHSFLVQFQCQPYKYSLQNEIITLQATGTIYNSGSTISKPIIKLFGTGSLTLTINGNIVNLTNVVDYVTVDSNLEECFKDLVYKNQYMTGLFPILEKGNNVISFTGATKIEITPNFRYI